MIWNVISTFDLSGLIGQVSSFELGKVGIY